MRKKNKPKVSISRRKRKRPSLVKSKLEMLIPSKDLKSPTKTKEISGVNIQNISAMWTSENYNKTEIEDLRREKDELKKEIVKIERKIGNKKISLKENGVFDFDILKQGELHEKLLKDVKDNFDEALALEKGVWEIGNIIKNKSEVEFSGEKLKFESGVFGVENDKMIQTQIKKSLKTNFNQRNVLIDLLNRIFFSLTSEVLSLRKYCKILQIGKIGKKFF